MSAVPPGTITEFTAGISSGVITEYIAAGPDGNLWFTEYFGQRIGQITPTGTVTEFSSGISSDAYPLGITAGPDGNLWFVENAGNLGFVGGCDAVEVSCALEAGHSGQHMSDPAPCRSLGWRRRWLVTRW